MNRFFKGVYRLRPSRSKYSKTWDVSSVLHKVSSWYPLESLNLQTLTQKLIIHLALGTGHRMQTFSLKNTNLIRFSETSAEIKVEALIKTSRVGTCQPYLMLPYFNDKPQLCVAKTLKHYFRFTKALRKETNCKKLFLTTRKPYKAVSSQTLSRWTKSVLYQCGNDKEFTAHSVRYAATSTAFKKGIDLNIIRSTVGWSQTSLTFARF